MVVRKFVIVTNEWFTNEKYNLYGIKKLEALGLEVEVWNTSRTRISSDLIPKKPKDMYEGRLLVRNFENRKEMRKCLRHSSDVLFIIFYPTSEPLHEFYRRHLKYITIEIDTRPRKIAEENIAAWNSEAKRKLTVKRLLHPRYNLRMTMQEKNPPMQCFMAAIADYYPMYRSWNKNIIRFVHHIDLDNYILDPDKSAVGEEYILFIDEAAGTHPELIGSETYQNSDFIKKYRKSMNRLFERLEKIYHLKTVIAAHPKAEYKGDEFGNREIIQFKTYDLIKKAALVVTHYSTMVDMAVLFKKKVLFVAYPKSEDTPIWRKIFDMTPLTIYEDEENIQNYIWHSQKACDYYIKNYLGNISHTKVYMEIIIDWIKDNMKIDKKLRKGQGEE